MRKDEAVTADASVVSNHNGLRGIDVAHLQDDRAASQREAGLGKHWAADVHLLSYPRILADGDALARHVTHRSDGRVAADRDVTPHHHCQETDFDVIGNVHVLANNHTAKLKRDVAADPITTKRPIGPHFQRAWQPAEQ